MWWRMRIEGGKQENKDESEIENITLIVSSNHSGGSVVTVVQFTIYIKKQNKNR